MALQCPAHHGPLKRRQGPNSAALSESSLAATRCSVCSSSLRNHDVLSCDECHFSICSECTAAAHKDVAQLPQWFQVLCGGPPGVVGEAFAFSGPNSADVDALVWPLDWTQTSDVAELVSEATARKLKPPSLILAADISYDPAMVSHLLETLLTIRDKWIRVDSPHSRAELLFCQEKRGTGIYLMIHGRSFHGVQTTRTNTRSSLVELLTPVIGIIDWFNHDWLSKGPKSRSAI